MSDPLGSRVILKSSIADWLATKCAQGDLVLNLNKLPYHFEFFPAKILDF